MEELTMDAPCRRRRNLWPDEEEMPLLHIRIRKAAAHVDLEIGIEHGASIPLLARLRKEHGRRSGIVDEERGHEAASKTLLEHDRNRCYAMHLDVCSGGWSHFLSRVCQPALLSNSAGVDMNRLESFLDPPEGWSR